MSESVNETIGLKNALGFETTADFAKEWSRLNPEEKEQMKEHYRAWKATQ